MYPSATADPRRGAAPRYGRPPRSRPAPPCGGDAVAAAVGDVLGSGAFYWVVGRPLAALLRLPGSARIAFSQRCSLPSVSLRLCLPPFPLLPPLSAAVPTDAVVKTGLVLPVSGDRRSGYGRCRHGYIAVSLLRPPPRRVRPSLPLLDSARPTAACRGNVCGRRRPCQLRKHLPASAPVMSRYPLTVSAASVLAASGCAVWSLLLAAAWVAAVAVCAAAAPGEGPSKAPSAASNGGGLRTVEVETDVLFEYSSAASLFPDLGGPSRWAARAGVSVASRPSMTTTHQFDGGSIDYSNADAIMSGDANVAIPKRGFDPADAKNCGTGWQQEGPGRVEGSGLKLRASLDDVLVVMFATAAQQSLKQLFDSTTQTFQSLAGLRQLRRSLERITYKALRGRAWDLAPSGAIGVVLRFGGLGARNGKGQHELLVVTASLVELDLVVACSAEERCLGDGGCSMRTSMVGALEKVRVAMGVSMDDLFMVLSAPLKTGRLEAGRGVLYGEKTCVVRNGNSSWPFSAVRCTRGGSWVCLSCRTGDGTCGHARAAVAAAKAELEGPDHSSDSEVEREDGSEERLLALSGLSAAGAAGDAEAAGAVELPPHLPGATEALLPVNRFKWSSRSHSPRHLVPPVVAQKERADLMRALRDPSQPVRYGAGALCPYCLVGRADNTRIDLKTCKVEFEDGVVRATVETWRCHQCLFRVLPDGKARGVVFHSCYTAYSEAFLFEVAVNLARNGSSVHSASYLREAFMELHTGSKYPLASKRMRTVKVLRSALLLYLALVIKGLPYDTVSCATCRRADGSYALVSFDGLQLGYRVKYKMAFTRTDIKIHAEPRASLVPCMITDEAMSKAIGSVLSVKREVLSAKSSKAITTLAAMRGHVMALAMLLGNIFVDGVEKSFAGDRPHLDGGSGERGWDPMVDGGASPELVAFLRGAFDVRTAARSIAISIEAAADDLRRRVPVALMQRVHALVVDVPPAAAVPPLASLVAPGGDSGLSAADKERGRKRVRQTVENGSGSESSSSSQTTSGSEVLLSEDDDGFDLPRPLPKQVKEVWERDAPLLAYGEALEEPALATTGGAMGAARLLTLSLPLLPHVPSTAASALKVIEFVRAVVVDPVVVWAPQGSWVAVDKLVAVLRSESFSLPSLAAVLRLPLVAEQRLLRGAVACLGPGLVTNPHLRVLLADVLSGLKRRVAEYDKWVGDADGTAAVEGNALDALRGAMAAAHPLHTFSHRDYTGGWLLPPASVMTYRSVYGEYTDQWDDYLRTGIWAPGLPVLRPMPGFSGAATVNTDLPSCRHDMGKENTHTGGTVGVFCGCAHPKCIGVMVLTGSESQRMPLEFVAQRFVKMPSTIVYDFACATLKSALVRLPYLARRVALKCDRFHWRENHTDCSGAMSPDSYVSLDGVNTSACEERNALSRRQQHHLRQMKQDQFITFTVYQQVLANAVAMHRDNKTMGVTCKWPEWYRRTHVDVSTSKNK